MAGLVDEKTFRMMVDYAMMVKAKRILPNYSARVKKMNVSGHSKYHAIFTYMTDLVEFNKFPTIVKDADFDAASKKVLFRGDKVDNLAQLVADFDYHYGAGTYCDGIFCTSSHAYAQTYAKGGGTIMTMGIKKDAKVASYDLLTDIGFALFDNKRPFWFNDDCKKLSDYLNALDKKERKFMAKILLDDLAKLAIVLGYDAIAISIDYDGFSHVYSILNRNAIVVKESEYKKITDATEVYKNGHIINKPDESFLME